MRFHVYCFLHHCVLCIPCWPVPLTRNIITRSINYHHLTIFGALEDKCIHILYLFNLKLVKHYRACFCIHEIRVPSLLQRTSSLLSHLIDEKSVIVVYGGAPHVTCSSWKNCYCVMSFCLQCGSDCTSLWNWLLDFKPSVGFYGHSVIIYSVCSEAPQYPLQGSWHQCVHSERRNKHF